jgi:hypothetical protein
MAGRTGGSDLVLLIAADAVSAYLNRIEYGGCVRAEEHEMHTFLF